MNSYKRLLFGCMFAILTVSSVSSAMPECRITVEGETQYIGIYQDGDSYNTQGVGKKVAVQEYKPILWSDSKERISAYQAEKDVISSCIANTSLKEDKCSSLVKCNVKRYFEQ